MKHKMIQPPREAVIFFRWFCHPEVQEDIEGDLIERFNQNLHAYSEKFRYTKYKDQYATKPSMITGDITSATDQL